MSPLILLMGLPSCGGGFGFPSPSAEKGKKEPQPHTENDPKQILEVPKSIDVDSVTEADINGYKETIKKKFKKRECPGEWYGGIGIQYNDPRGGFSEGKIIFNLVPDGYPAAKAGIEVGDQAMDNMTDYRGEVGKEVTVNVRKPDGRLKNYTMLREKICLKEKDEK